MNGGRAVEALIPVKGFDRAKGRLGNLLTPHERVQLVRAMLTDVVAAAQDVAAIRRIWVTTADPALLQLADTLGAEPLPEPPDRRGLNPALEAAAAAIAGGAASPSDLLLLQGDVPAVSSAALQRFMHSDARGSDSKLYVRICPSNDGGTNALLLRPPTVIPFRFGPNSAALHAAAARALGIDFQLRSEAELAIDIDKPEDIERCLTDGCGEQTRELLLSLSIAERLIQLEIRRSAVP